MCTDNMLYIKNPAITAGNLPPFEQVLPLTNSYEPVGMVRTHSIIHDIHWFMILSYVSALIQRLHQTIPITKNYQLPELMTIQTAQQK